MITQRNTMLVQLASMHVPPTEYDDCTARIHACIIQRESMRGCNRTAAPTKWMMGHMGGISLMMASCHCRSPAYCTTKVWLCSPLAARRQVNRRYLNWCGLCGAGAGAVAAHQPRCAGHTEARPTAQRIGISSSIHGLPGWRPQGMVGQSWADYPLQKLPAVPVGGGHTQTGSRALHR